jgi:hypothetical protein
MLQVGRIYWLRFPGIAARVIEAPAGLATSTHTNLVEGLVLRARWYVNDQGEPTHSHCPQLIVPESAAANLEGPLRASGA